ncbi:MAG: hypothetical protein UT55_C0033G0015 [Candidatus Peregrinibacteria bacterium GW2011_GWE2_39_6]|nr:MAG: hypothetical protein UT36_C0001G0169 [Candidatus Peregrinibacteria bacterium GW2011_GWF2_39_17]KKR25691.1 MAG: hypothetical protein UT55_C0033G0015 [Candidatus Peregrinibacteria bacterium GW2011_GWE2_39_6]HCW32607.1 hypothetical protein [Candidatus Peregrinibacteria bacterium]
MESPLHSDQPNSIDIVVGINGHTLNDLSLGILGMGLGAELKNVDGVIVVENPDPDGEGATRHELILNGRPLTQDGLKRAIKAARMPNTCEQLTLSAEIGPKIGDKKVASKTYEGQQGLDEQDSLPISGRTAAEGISGLSFVAILALLAQKFRKWRKHAIQAKEEITSLKRSKEVTQRELGEARTERIRAGRNYEETLKALFKTRAELGASQKEINGLRKLLGVARLELSEMKSQLMTESSSGALYSSRIEDEKAAMQTHIDGTRERDQKKIALLEAEVFTLTDERNVALDRLRRELENREKFTASEVVQLTQQIEEAEETIAHLKAQLKKRKSKKLPDASQPAVIASDESKIDQPDHPDLDLNMITITPDWEGATLLLEALRDGEDIQDKLSEMEQRPPIPIRLNPDKGVNNKQD